jgi:hypothetical protein
MHEPSTAGFEPQLIMSQQSRQETEAETLNGGPLGALREVPGLPLRVGRHLTAWVVWHTARVSLLPDRVPAELRERSHG